MKGSLSPITDCVPQLIATATLVIDTSGSSFAEITREVMRFVAESRAKDGALFLFARHTSASLVIQENADPDVRILQVGSIALHPRLPAGFMIPKGPTTCRRT